MQNHNTLNTTGFVPLDGGWDLGFWQCSNCGCTNCNCDSCTACGWNPNGNCGCNQCNRVTSKTGGASEQTVDANIRCAAANAGCTTCQTRQEQCGGERGTCDGCQSCQQPCNNGCNTCQQPRQNAAPCMACPPEKRPQQVRPCPANTYVREFPCDGGAGCAATGNAKGAANWHCNTTKYVNDNANSSCNTTCNAGCNTCQPCATTCNNGCTTNQPCNSTCTPGCAAAQPCAPACTGNASCPLNRTATAAERARNRAVGMVYAAKQTVDQLYTSESALRSGTLFPELHKPMNGYCPGDCNCATPCQESAFALWELRLYLDTHPDDAQAQALFRRLSQEASEPNYASAFLPDEDLSDGWDWTQEPWPWQCGPCGQ